MKKIKIIKGNLADYNYPAYIVGRNIFGGFDCKVMDCNRLFSDWSNLVLFEGEFKYLD